MKKQSYEEQVKEYYPDAYCAENAVSHKFVIIESFKGPTLSKKHHKFEENAWKEVAQQPKEFTITLTQLWSVVGEGQIEIKAKNEQEAINKAKKMSQKQLKKLSTDWEEMAPAYNTPDPIGDIEVWE